MEDLSAEQTPGHHGLGVFERAVTLANLELLVQIVLHDDGMFSLYSSSSNH